MSNASIPNLAAAGNKPPPRRWIPVSLKIFVALLALAGLGTARWVAIPAYRQHNAIREIERLGGTVVMQPTGPSWFRDLVGDEWMRSLDKTDGVQLDGTRATDATLRQIGVLTDARGLCLEGTQVTDAGLAHLTGLTDLRFLRLNGTAVSDAGLAKIAELRSLEAICLDHTRINDAGLLYLRQMPNLQALFLSDTNVTDAALVTWKQSHPNVQVVVERVLATPADPIPPESDIVRFRFRHGRGRRHTAGGIQEMPESDFGELLFERKTGRCLYRYWYDGVNERPQGWRIEPRDLPEENTKPRDRVRIPLKAAVAFDGNRHWLATYNANRPRPYADRMEIYDSDDGLDQHNPASEPAGRLRPWSMQAPLHALASGVDCEAIERNKIHEAIKAFPLTKAVGPHASDVTVRGWHYIISLDQSDLGIRFIKVSLAGAWAGSWPFAVPTSYSMERENAGDVSGEELETLTTFELYIDESTVVVE